MAFRTRSDPPCPGTATAEGPGSATAKASGDQRRQPRRAAASGRPFRGLAPPRSGLDARSQAGWDIANLRHRREPNAGPAPHQHERSLDRIISRERGRNPCFAESGSHPGNSRAAGPPRSSRRASTGSARRVHLEGRFTSCAENSAPIRPLWIPGKRTSIGDHPTCVDQRRRSDVQASLHPIQLDGIVEIQHTGEAAQS